MPITLIAENLCSPVRVDQFLATNLRSSTRSTIQKLIETKNVSLNGQIITKTSKMVRNGDIITVISPQKAARTVHPAAQEKHQEFFEQRCIYEHEHFWVLNKPAGLVAHPPHPEHHELALIDYLVAHEPTIASVGEMERPGLVHRLDKFTSGVILVARTVYGYETLKELFKQRAIKKVYFALLEGTPPATAHVTISIMRDPVNPARFMATHANPAGKQAITDFEVQEQFKQHALVKASPLTGRTHQIRIHAAHLGHPVVGDTIYGLSSQSFERYFLHAHQISFSFDGADFEFTCPLPEDFDSLAQAKKNQSCN